MPSIKVTTPILGGRYYHLFNRGSNKQAIFYSEENYNYFLLQLKSFLIDYFDVLAYCLLPNHFHLVVKIKDEIYLDAENRSLSSECIQKGSLGGKENIRNGSIRKISNEEEVGKLAVRQLKRFFITYAMAINKQEDRVGNLFDPKYKRLEITNQDYLEYAIFYAHYNPEKHGLISDFKKYKNSSFKAILANSKTNIDRDFVFDLYGGKDEFVNYHNIMHDEREAIKLE